MTRGVFLDTVGLVGVWETRDRWHRAAAPVFELLLASRVPLFTTTFVLLECANAVARKPYRSDVVELRTYLEEEDLIVHPTLDDWEQAWFHYQRGDYGGAGLVDNVSFVVMRRLGIARAFTNDKHFAAAGLDVMF